MNKKFSPKVSMIIPVFNAEKYLSVCLESVLIQTFTDFELIVVDDCSTDSSLAIAENYLEKFGGRLKIITLEENTGSGVVPRNVGLEFARGKYIYFVDNDDFLIDTALETLFDFAEKYQAQVVYMEKFFSCGEEPVPTELNLSAWCHNKSFAEKPTFETKNLSERVEKFLQSTFCWTPWSKFLRRDFLIGNNINFPPMTIANDVVHTLKLICLAENFLRVPTPLYVHRENTSSIMLKKRSPEQMIKFRTSPLIIGLESLDEFMRGLDFFKQNPVIRLQVLNFFALMQFANMSEALKVLEPQEAYEVFLQEFSKAGSSQPALISYLLVMNSILRSELTK